MAGLLAKLGHGRGDLIRMAVQPHHHGLIGHGVEEDDPRQQSGHNIVNTSYGEDNNSHLASWPRSCAVIRWPGTAWRTLATTRPVAALTELREGAEL